ncbi:MAG: MBL fold metallo-hydrolase [Saprospiraceae bacterium]|nr:MAG: MBL fold metallo-hydrolase [Saprospiraceae bacterium]
MLRESIDHLDAILLTHEHNDHIIGMDDVRPFNFSQQTDMPVYATERVEGELKQRFSYVFEAVPYPGAPQLQLHRIDASTPFTAASIGIMPVAIFHGNLPILGFRIGNFAYLTDVKTIPEAEMTKLTGLNTLVLNALHMNPHRTHLNVPEALQMIETIQPKQAYLTHVSHRMGLYAEVEKQLPKGVNLAYDGLSFKDSF